MIIDIDNLRLKCIIACYTNNDYYLTLIGYYGINARAFANGCIIIDNTLAVLVLGNRDTKIFDSIPFITLQKVSKICLNIIFNFYISNKFSNFG